MLVSIIIPIYNVAPYVEKCLRSVMAQTYKKLEVIIVDDCGTDNSMEIVERIVAENSGSEISFKVLHHEKNRGLSAARNTGIKAATGEYLYFLDSDDIIRKWCIGLMVSLAKKYPGVDIVQGAYFSDPPESIAWTHSSMLFPNGVEYLQDSDDCRTLLQQKGHLGFAHNKLTRRLLIIDNNFYFDERIRLGWEDSLWTFLVGRCIKDMAFCNLPIYGYRYRGGSISRTITSKEMAHAIAVLSVRILSTLSYNKWILTELRFVWWRIVWAKGLGMKIKDLIHEYRLCHSMGGR